MSFLSGILIGMIICNIIDFLEEKEKREFFRPQPSAEKEDKHK